MLPPDLQNQALHVPLPDRWQLVQALLTSIQQDTQTEPPHSLTLPPLTEPSLNPTLSPWIQSLIGVIQPPPEDSLDTYFEDSLTQPLPNHSLTQP